MCDCARPTSFSRDIGESGPTGPEVSPWTTGKGWPVEWGGCLDVFHLNSSVFVWFSFADIPSESGKT